MFQFYIFCFTEVIAIKKKSCRFVAHSRMMLSKNQIKFINTLKQKKVREEEQLFIIEGSKMVAEVLNASVTVKNVYATAAFIKEHSLENNPLCEEVTAAELDKITNLVTANEAFAICEIPKTEFNPAVLKNKLTIVLDEIKDPGNLGTIIRIADWFGIENIVCSENTVDAYNPKVVQSTMGSITRINVFYTDLIKFMENNTIKAYGALLAGENVYQQQLPKEALLVIGNESKGIRNELIPFITNKLTIPSFSHIKSSGGEAESLNAAIATAILCSEFRRG